MHNVATMQNRHELRRAEREDVFLVTPASVAGRKSIDVHLVNISRLGCMIRSAEPCVQGDSLTIRLPIVGDLKAVAAWALGGRIGCQFERGIEENRYASVLSAIKAQRRSWIAD